MLFSRVQVFSLRNLSVIDISPASDFNLFYGENGSGKTSLLEALHLLAFGRSPRTSKTKSVISIDASQSTVSCVLRDTLTADKEETRIGISIKDDGSKALKRDGQSIASLSELSKLVPLVYMSPQTTDTVFGSPKGRRGFCDWLVFHVKPSFGHQHKLYRDCLRQRNAVLRAVASKSSTLSEEAYWRNQLAQIAKPVVDARAEVMQDFIAFCQPIVDSQMLENHGVQVNIKFFEGYANNEFSFLEKLEADLESDLINGFTRSGPHRSDLRLKVGRLGIEESLSRGQLRVCTNMIQLAAVSYLSKVTGKSSVLLVDDIGAELDDKNISLLINTAKESASQTFVTSISKNTIERFSRFPETKMFHVKQGSITEEEINV